MILSSLFARHQVPAPRFAPGLFVALVAVFVLLSQSKPLVGLTGLGTTAIVAAALVEFNRVRIWETYLKSYKKRKGPKSIWTAPKTVYYTINVVLLWPLVMLLGVACLYAAYVRA